MPPCGVMWQCLDTVWVVINGVEHATGILWVETKEAAQRPSMYKTVSLTPSNVSRAKTEESWLRQNQSYNELTQ